MNKKDEVIAIMMRACGQEGTALFVEEGIIDLFERVNKRGRAEGLKPHDVVAGCVEICARNISTFLDVSLAEGVERETVAATLSADFFVMLMQEKK